MMSCWPRQRCWIFSLAAIFSLALSAWISGSEPVINPDGMCYLQSAATFKTAGLHAAMSVCDQAKWPFYSILIAGVSSLTHLSLTTSAYVLNALFSMLSVLAFIAIVRQLGGNERLLALAAFVILVPHEFNSVREYIIRDHGFWAFYLLSLLMMLKFFRAPSWRYAFAWSASTILATLFRVEGALFLVLLPFAAFFNSKHKLQSFLQLNALSFLGLVAVSVWCLVHSIQEMGRVSELSFQILHGPALLRDHFTANANSLAHAVLSPYSVRDASLILVLMLLAWYVASIAINLSLIYSLLVAFAMSRRLLVMDAYAKVTVWSYIIVNVLITGTFLFENMFLSKRYLIALSLVLMLWVPFALNKLIQFRYIRKWPLYLAIFLIILNFLGGVVHYGHSKVYIREAGDWLAENSPPTAKIYSNDKAILYYSKHFGNDLFKTAEAQADVMTIAHGKWKQYDYVALEANNKNQDLIKIVKDEIGGEPIKTFVGGHNRDVSIYKIK